MSREYFATGSNVFGQIDDIILIFSMDNDLKPSMEYKDFSIRRFNFSNGNSMIIDYPNKDFPYKTKIIIILADDKSQRTFHTDRMGLLEMLDSLYDQFGK